MQYIEDNDRLTYKKNMIIDNIIFIFYNIHHPSLFIKFTMVSPIMILKVVGMDNEAVEGIKVVFAF